MASIVAGKVISSEGFDRSVPDFRKDYFDRLSEKIGGLRIFEGPAKNLKRRRVAEQGIAPIFRFSFNGISIQAIPAGKIRAVRIGDILSGLLCDMAEDDDVKAFQDGRRPLRVRRRKLSAPAGNGKEY